MSGPGSSRWPTSSTVAARPPAATRRRRADSTSGTSPVTCASRPWSERWKAGERPLAPAITKRMSGPFAQPFGGRDEVPDALGRGEPGRGRRPGRRRASTPLVGAAARSGRPMASGLWTTSQRAIRRHRARTLPSMAITRSTLRPMIRRLRRTSQAGRGSATLRACITTAAPDRRAITAACSIPRSLRWTMSGRAALDGGSQSPPMAQVQRSSDPAPTRRRPRSGIPAIECSIETPPIGRTARRTGGGRRRPGPPGSRRTGSTASRRQVSDEVQKARARAVGGGRVHHVQHAQAVGSGIGPSLTRGGPRRRTRAGRSANPNDAVRRTIPRHHSVMTVARRTPETPDRRRWFAPGDRRPRERGR